MAVSWNLTTTTVTLTTLTTSYHSCQDIVDGVANTTYADTLLSPGDGTASASAGTWIYLFSGVKFVLNDNARWEDHSCVILHTLNSSSQAITFNSTTSTIEWGYLDDTDPDKPVTCLASTTAANIRAACVYSFQSDNSSQTWSDNDSGTFNMYGGMMKFRDDTSGSKSDPVGENETYTIEFPHDTSIIQCNLENFGGAKFSGTSYRIQESTFKTSRNTGMDFIGASTDRLIDIKTMNSDIGLDFTGSASVTLTQVALRGHTDDLRVNGLSGTITLLNSDTISSTHTTMSFTGAGAVLEANTYDASIVDTSGDGINGVRVFVYQKSSGGSVGYGSEQVSSGGGAGTAATVGQVTVSRYNYDSSHASYGARESFGNFAVRLRDYGLKYLDIEKVPEEKALSDEFIMETNPYVDVIEATAAAYTGIAIDEGNSEIDLTSAHTIQEVYDYLQAKQDDSNEMDIEELLITNDGVSYTIPATWSITGLSYLDLSGAYIIGRYVPITVTGVVEDTRCAVVEDPDGTNTLLGQKVAGVGETEVTIAVAYTASASISVRARYADVTGDTGYVPFESTTTISPTGNTVAANIQSDVNFNL